MLKTYCVTPKNTSNPRLVSDKQVYNNIKYYLSYYFYSVCPSFLNRHFYVSYIFTFATRCIGLFVYESFFFFFFFHKLFKFKVFTFKPSKNNSLQATKIFNFLLLFITLKRCNQPFSSLKDKVIWQQRTFGQQQGFMLAVILRVVITTRASDGGSDNHIKPLESQNVLSQISITLVLKSLYRCKHN